MALAAERAALGHPVLHMEVGEPNFPTPEHIVAASFAAVRNGATGYTPNAGTVGLRSAVADRVNSRLDLDVDISNVCITSGAVMALYLALMAIIEPGDEVLIPDPGWPNYQSAVTMAQGESVTYELDPASGYTLDIAELAARLTPRTRVIMINFPGNPTGGIISPERMRELLVFANENDLWVISDEVYEDFTYGATHTSVLLDGLLERLIMVSGASKSYSMTGWRIGWMVAASNIITAAIKLIEPLTSCPSSVSQAAAETALRGSQYSVEAMHAAYEAGAAIAAEILQPAGLLPFVPRGAFYALVEIGASGLSSDEFTRRLLDERGVAVAPGLTFGQSSSTLVRISTALTEADLRRGCETIRDFVAFLATEKASA
jgi:aspartate aminotransferase/aminotransferase